jgi:hypothetical protein
MKQALQTQTFLNKHICAAGASQIPPIIPEPSAAQCDNIKIVIGITTIQTHYHKRQWARETYMQYSNVYHHEHRPDGTVLVLFVLGVPPNDARDEGMHDWLQMNFFDERLSSSIAETSDTHKGCTHGTSSSTALFGIVILARDLHQDSHQLAPSHAVCRDFFPGLLGKRLTTET